MNHAPGLCSRDAIKRFLENRLNPAEQNELELHLDACDDCCEQLQSMTADARQWSNAQENLGDAGSVLSDGPHEQQSEISLDFLTPTDDPHRLGRFAGYEIAGVVGQGGMGIVLKGFDSALNRFVAIKVLRPHYASSVAARKRFAREAKAAAAVVHDNVIEIYGVSVEDNTKTLPYLVMPYVRGESLQKRLDRCGPLTTAESLRISIQIASGLAVAHEQGLVHRDIKPANILLLDDVERVKITDFGLARTADDASLTRTGVIAGTPQYMSPEQAEGGKINGQSDLFSLGSLMYSMCSGRIPFRADTPLGVLRRIVDDDPRPIQQINPEVPSWLCHLIEKLHQKNPEHRYKSSNELAQVLKQCLAHVQQPDTVDLPRDVVLLNRNEGQTATTIRNLLGMGVLIMILVLLSGIVGWSTWNTAHEPPSSQVTAAAVQDGQPFRREFTAAFADASKTGTLDVNLKRGSITVVGHDQPNVIVELEVPNYSPSSTDANGLKELRPSNLDFDIETDKNHIKVDSNSDRFITNLKIKVPRHTDLVLDSYRDGALQVTDVQGKLNARSFCNDITLKNCSGSARLYSYHGNLVASLTAISKEMPLQFETYNGLVDVSLPTEVQLNTQLCTVRGKLLTDFDITETSDSVQVESQNDGTTKIKFDKYVRGTINGGGVLLKIETQNDDIRIRKHVSESAETKLGERLGAQIDQRIGRKIGDEWNAQLGDKLSQEWNARLNGNPGRDK